MSPRTGWLLAAAIALVHIGLAAWLASITPYRASGLIFGKESKDIGAPDERQHANYVSHLMRGQGFPVFKPGDPNLYETYQSHQPPLYYLLAAGWCEVTGSADLEDKGAGFRLRLLNCLLGGLEVVSVFCLGWRGFRKPEVGVVAASFAALLPMNVALSGAASNDVLLFLLCTVTLALCARSLHEGWSSGRALAVGLCVGFALLTKTTALALVPAVLLAAFVAGEGKPKARAVALALVPILLLPLPWWVRNQQLYGDPFAMTAFTQAFVGNPQAKGFISDPNTGLVGYLLGWVGWWTARSFFGVFGYMDIWLNESGHPMAETPNTLYRVLSAVSVLVFIAWLWSWKSLKERSERSVQIVNTAFFVVVLLLFLRFNMQYFQAQARYLLPAIGPISCGFALGFITLFKGRWAPALAAMLLLFGGTTIYAGTRIPGEFEKRMSVQ